MTETRIQCAAINSLGQRCRDAVGHAGGHTLLAPSGAPWNESPSPSDTLVSRESGTPGCALGGGGEPTPEALEAWAEWAYINMKDESRYLGPNQLHSTGYLLREIARRLRANKGGVNGCGLSGVGRKIDAHTSPQRS